jgi:hypothetical protein
VVYARERKGKFRNIPKRAAYETEEQYCTTIQS